MLVDYEFIEELEGFSLVGYVPDHNNSKSGVTIACGFDIGARKRQFIAKNFEPSLAVKLLPYCGVKGLSAKLMTNFMPLKITREEASTINRVVQNQAIERLLASWSKATSTAFDALSIEQRTVVASVSFQYGSLAAKAPKFWLQVTAGDWYAALANLRDFKDRYKTRRNKEADLLENYLKK